MKKLIVTGDDVGLHPGITDGVMRAFREGIVTACSVVPSGEDFDRAVELIRGSEIDTGVHLTLVEERPCSPVGVRTLLRDDGRLHRNYISFTARYFAGAIELADVEREFRAQIERAISAGIRVRHLNSHQHLHVLPEIFELVFKLAAEYRVSYVRVIDDRGGRAAIGRRVALRVLNRFGRRAREVVRNEHMKASRAGRLAPFSNQYTIGVAEAGGFTTASLIALLRAVPDGVTELVCHPGIDDAAIAGRYKWRYGWERETEALCSAEVRNVIEELAIERVSTRSLVHGIRPSSGAFARPERPL